jgi:hypothetical protein
MPTFVGMTGIAPSSPTARRFQLWWRITGDAGRLSREAR